MKRAKSNKGAALVEFALALPIMIFMCAAVVDIGSFFYQMELASDAVRYGLREASKKSYSPDLSFISCAYVRNEANRLTSTYMTNALKIPRHRWDFVDGGTRICGIGGDGLTYKIPVIQQTVTVVQNNTGTCLFCYLGNFFDIHPKITYSTILQGQCCEDMSDPSFCAMTVDDC